MPKSRDNRDRVDHTRQTAIRLFQDQDRGHVRDIVAEVGPTTPRNETWVSSLLPSCIPQLFRTSPTTRRRTPVPPNAPIKPKKLFSKEGLKPKKLRFTDKEKDETEEEEVEEEEVEVEEEKEEEQEQEEEEQEQQEQEQEEDETCCLRTNIDFYSTKRSKQKTEFFKQQDELKKRLDRGNLSAMLQSIRLELDNKENRRYGQGRYEKGTRINHSVTKERTKNNDSTQLSKLNCNPKEFEKCPIILSPCRDTWSKEEKLLWLQSRRDVGMWIQCCRKYCKKWRYCDDFHDPVDVPKIWYCKMNSNKIVASCFVPEVPNSKEIEEDLIENKYNAGSLVWGRVNGSPWWPAIIDDCPQTLRFYELEESSRIPIKYYVTFFKNYLQSAWLNVNDIKTFIKYKKTFMRKQNRFNEGNYKKLLEEAYILAQSAVPLSISERLQRFSCISRLRNLQVTVTQPTYEQVDEISSTPTEYITLKEFYLKNKRCYKNER